MWLTCLTVIRFNSIQWESNSLPSPPHPRTCLRFQFNSFQWQCDAMRFDSILFWLSLSAWLPVFPVCFSRRRLSNLLICLSALVAVVVATQLAKKSMLTSTALHQSRRCDWIYIYLHFPFPFSHSPALPLSPHFLIRQIDLYLLLEPNEDKCLRISLWAVLGSRLIDMWVEPRGKMNSV